LLVSQTYYVQVMYTLYLNAKAWKHLLMLEY